METAGIAGNASRAWKRRMEIATNGAVGVAAILVTVYFAVLLVARFDPPEPTYGAAVGTRLGLPAVYDFASHEQTLLVALQDRCAECEASMPFFGEVATRLDGAQCIGMVAVLPHPPPRSDTLLQRHDLSIPRLASTSLASLGVLATPTLILVDGKGTVLRAWAGKLSHSQEQEVLDAIDPVARCGE